MAIAIALFTAAALVAVGVYTGYPIATAFTVTGTVVGVGLAHGGDPAWTTYRKIISLWVIVPFIGSSLAYATACLLRDNRISEQIVVPVLAGIVGLIVTNMEFIFLGSPGESVSLAATVATTVALVPVISVSLAHISVSFTVATGCTCVVASDISTDVTAGQRRSCLHLVALSRSLPAVARSVLRLVPSCRSVIRFPSPMSGYLLVGVSVF